MTTERTGELTFLGDPLTVLGEKIEVGQKAPDFELLNTDMETVAFSDSAGKVRLLSVVPSLDTSVCDAQTRRMNEEAAKYGDEVIVYTVSADLPFAQKRWCGAAGIEQVVPLSDHKEMSFGKAYGTHIKELRLEQRAIFIVDEDGVVRYVEYVPEVSHHPDYDAALEALDDVVG